MWQRLQAFPQVFDDFGRGDFKGLLAKLSRRDNLFFDIGPGLGLACAFAVRPGLDAVIHLVMFDRKLRGREGVFLDILRWGFERLQLRRCTAMLPADARTGRKLLERLGFVQEGLMREAMLREGKLVDLEIYGMLREEFDASYEAYTNGSAPDHGTGNGSATVPLATDTGE